jgi:hypothetical protein
LEGPIFSVPNRQTAKDYWLIDLWLEAARYITKDIVNVFKLNIHARLHHLIGSLTHITASSTSDEGENEESETDLHPRHIHITTSAGFANQKQILMIPEYRFHICIPPRR